MNKIVNFYAIFSTRTANILKWADIFTWEQLIDKSSQEMLKTPNFGRNSLREIEDFLQKFNMYFKNPYINKDVYKYCCNEFKLDLTIRQKEVISILSENISTKHIANMTGLKYNRIHQHIFNIRSKIIKKYTALNRIDLIPNEDVKSIPVTKSFILEYIENYPHE